MSKPYRKFGGALRNQMTRRHITQNDLSARVGVGQSAMSKWVKGESLPRAATVARLAEELDSHFLSEMALEIRRRTCVFCGVLFTAGDVRPRALFCRKQCSDRNRENNLREDRNRTRRNMNEELTVMVGELQAVLDAGCRVCEPGGVCHDGGCVYRDGSPLPLIAKAGA